MRLFRILIPTGVVIAISILAGAQNATSGRIEGTLKIGGVPKGGETIGLIDQSGMNRGTPLQAKTDAQGHFVFEQVPPGRYLAGYVKDVPVRMNGSVMPMQAITNAHILFVKAGDNVTLDLGGKGRKVIGRMALPEDAQMKVEWQGATNRRMVTHSDFPKPPEGLSKPEQQAWMQKTSESEEFKSLLSKRIMFIVDVAADGTFSVDDVPPGVYDLDIDVGDAGAVGPGRPLGRVSTTITVPETPVDQPFDAGVIPVKLFPNLKVGDPAPAFSVPGLDGKNVTLGDYRGKYVLLDFWATWCMPCKIELPHVLEVYKQYGQNPKFAIIGLSLDPEQETLERFVKDKGMGWPQGLLRDWRETDVPERYGVNGIPAMFLVDPEGKIVARDLRGQAIADAVEKALKNSAK